MLSEYKRADISYVPHITLGAFTREPARVTQAFEEASKLHLDASSVVDRLELVKINAERTTVVWQKPFLLGH